MVMNGCEVVVVYDGLGVTSTKSVLIGSLSKFVTDGLLVGNVTFLLINGRTVDSVTRRVGFVRTIVVVGRFDKIDCGVVVVDGRRVVVIGFGVVAVTRTLFFVVDEVSFSGLLTATTLAVGRCRFVGLVVVIVGRLLGLFVLSVVGALVVVVTVSCTD